MAGLNDTFTGAAGNLTGHTSNSGHTWSTVSGTGVISLTGSGTIYSSSVSTVSIYNSSWTPAGIGIDFSFTLGEFGLAGFAGVAFNSSLSTVSVGSYYLFRFNGATTQHWEFDKIVSGVVSLTTTYAGAATDTLSVSVRRVGSDNVITVTINGTPQTPITDSSSPLAAGAFGVWLFGDGNPGSGENLNSVTADDATATWSVAPATATIDIGATTTLVASGFTGGSVNWSSNHTGTATVNSGGVVTGQPHHQATPQTATITATGVSNPSETATCVVTVNAAIVTVTPNPANVPLSGNRQFFAAVVGATNTSVTWSVSGGGSINSSTGYYTAPSGAASPITVTATSAADTSRTGTSTVAAIAGTDTVLPVAGFGPVYAGLTTVQYKLFDTAHSVVAAFSADDVLEIPMGSGYYGATEPLSASFSGWIYWRTESVSPVYAVAVVQPASGTGTLTRPLPPAAFGPGYTGLSTVGYRLLNADGSESATWTTTGVTEDVSGSGIYTVSKSLASTFTGVIEWRTDSGMTVTQSAEIAPLGGTGGGGLSRVLTGM